MIWAWKDNDYPNNTFRVVIKGSYLAVLQHQWSHVTRKQNSTHPCIDFMCRKQNFLDLTNSSESYKNIKFLQTTS